MEFLEALSIRNIAFRKHPDPEEVWICCPFCNEDRFRLGLNFKKNVAHCFNCGWKSRKAIPDYLSAVRIHAAVDGYEAREEESAPVVELPEDFTLLWTLEPSDGAEWFAAREYLERRGVTEVQMRQYDLGASWTGRFSYRVIFPVVFQDRLLGLVGRDFTGYRKPKYLNSIGVKTVYGLRQRAGSELLILSEGCLKALAIARIAPDVCSASLLGSSVTEGQIEQIRASGFREVCLFSDPDRPGKIGALKIARAFADSGVRVSMVYPIPTKQADDFSPDELRFQVEKNIRRFDATTEMKLKGELCRTSA